MEVDKGKRNVCFGVVKDKNIQKTNGTMQNRGNVLCPYCEQVTPVADLRTAGNTGNIGERMVAVIVEDKDGKGYRPIEAIDLNAFGEAEKFEVERPQEKIYDGIVGIPSSSIISPALYYGMPKWGDLFNHRQLVAMQTFIKCLHEALGAMKEEISDEYYRGVVGIYLGLWVSRIASRCSNVGIWHTKGEKLEHPFGRQAIPMTWDYPESVPFSEATGGAAGQLEWILRIIAHESNSKPSAKVSIGDAGGLPLTDKVVDTVVTDPPYFDAIAYGDLSDFFYVWLKRALHDVVPEIFTTPVHATYS
jgi:adenine-specific DNA methylase